MWSAAHTVRSVYLSNSTEQQAKFASPPKIGEHSNELLHRFGFEDVAIQALHEGGPVR